MVNDGRVSMINGKRIVAIIPARIHTKRVPNKLIRLVGKHPLVYYMINTAINSDYIDEIIVSTDSVKIALLARQLGVNCIMRDPSICKDETPLDIVVYEAIKQIECDFCVTLQPTSPLLKTQTLDDALKKCVYDDVDSVISVINSPRLAWKNEKIPKPLYEERLNSQYLPPYYEETGAFLITKKECISENNRIGNKIRLYEVSKEEAVSVCDFQDLALVNAIINQKKVAIYVNGNNSRGMGHVYRALELADEFYEKVDLYFDINETSEIVFGETDYNLISVDGIKGLYEALNDKEYDIFINDILSTTKEYVDNLKSIMPNTKIVNFEDEGTGIYSADLVINALLSSNNANNVKCGEKYYVAPKSFLFFEPIEIKDRVKNVLVTFGGADPQSYSLQLLKIISKNEEFCCYNFVVVVGKATKHIEKIMSYQKNNIKVVYDAQNMAEIMSQVDVAVTSRGRTGYELAVMGIPAIAIAQNEREETHYFMSHENGFNYLGRNPSDATIEFNLKLLLESSLDERMELQRRMLKNNLRDGRSRIIHLINSL